MLKKIVWESWNEKEQITPEDKKSYYKPEEEYNAFDDNADNMSNLHNFLSVDPNIIFTPFGEVPQMSQLKPSDRWQCWIGHTNFTITKDMANKMKDVNGIAAIKIMDRYTFCVGIAKMFDSSRVKKDIESETTK